MNFANISLILKIMAPAFAAFDIHKNRIKFYQNQYLIPEQPAMNKMIRFPVTRNTYEQQ